MRKILVVDDEQDVEELFRQIFRGEIRRGEMDLQFVLSAQSALDYIQGLQPFDLVLVLTDINMPGQSGFDLLRKIREKFPELQVFMIWAYDDTTNFEEAKKLGANDFIPKPVDFIRLKESIAKVLLN